MSDKIRNTLYALVGVVGILSIIGLVMLYSTTSAMFGEQKLKQQALWMAVGLILALILYRVDYRHLGSVSHVLLLIISLPLIYLAGIHLLSIFGVPDSVLAKFPLVGEGATKGAYRWLKIGGRSLQPSEFAKLAIILFLARYYGANPRYVLSFRYGLFYPGIIVSLVLIAILLGGSLSITCITAMVIVAMLFVAGVRLRWFIGMILIGTGMIAAVIAISPERLSRLTTFRNPEKFKEGSGYQLYHSQLALGSGSWHGIGFNRSRMKEYYLPEAHTDFIMAIVGEELGYGSVIGILFLYLFLVGVAFAIAALAIDREGVLLAFGIGVAIGLHAIINISVVSGFMPTTGVTAPLISYGGSNILMTWASIGLLASICRVAQKHVGDPGLARHWRVDEKPVVYLNRSHFVYMD